MGQCYNIRLAAYAPVMYLPHAEPALLVCLGLAQDGAKIGELYKAGAVYTRLRLGVRSSSS